jgi:hypothetical protein
MKRILLILVLLEMWIAAPVQAQSDSLQFRLFHGLDEIGSDTHYYLDLHNSLFWSKIRGDASGLYRRSSGSQGDLKTDASLSGEIGRSLGPNFDLKTIFESNYYKFLQFRGPLPFAVPYTSPASFWNLSASQGQLSSPTQKINRSMLGLGGTYSPQDNLMITGVAGGRWDRREGYYDHGYNASLTGRLDSVILSGYKNDLDLFLEQEELGDRLNRDLKLNYGLEMEFSPRSTNRLFVHYRQKRYDYHIWGTGSIGSRFDGDRSLQNQLLYDINNNIRLLWDTQFGDFRHEDRSANGTTVRLETNTATALTLRAAQKLVAEWIRLRFDWGAQEDVTGLKRERGTNLESGITCSVTSRDSLDFTTSVRKRQYDTSDTSNYDDRDRLRYDFDLFYEHDFSSQFKVSQRAEVILEHLVYIFGQKSDQNNWNRIFRLLPEIYFKPHPDISNRARFELVANLSDYDFELDPAFIRSTIYRRYTASDSLTWSPHSGWDVVGEYSLSLEDGGRLLWDQWIQQISEEYRSHLFSLILERHTQMGIRFDLGFTIYERKGWEYSVGTDGQTQKLPFYYLTRWGPLLRLSYPSNARVTIEAGGDLSWVHEWDRSDYTIVNLDLRATWR